MSFTIQVWPVSQLPGLSHENAVQLRGLGIETTQDLLKHTRLPQSLQNTANKLRLAPKHLKKWTALASLAQLPSVGCQHCGLILHSGIATIVQLSTAAPGSLYSQVLKLHTATMRRSDLCPTPDKVVCWIQDAKQFVRSQ